MQYRNLGRSGLKVSSVSLGSWLTYGTTVDQGVVDRIVHRAFDLGINLFDTADIYNKGEGEISLGKAVADLPRERLVLASKCFFPMSDDVNDRGLSRKHIFESIRKSLSRLRTDYLDLYQCHRPDPETPVEETAMAMDDLIRQGLILYWGVSCWPAPLIMRAASFCRAEGLHRPVSNQPQYNLFDREIEADVIPTSMEMGMGQIVWSPLAQGVLTGKYRDGDAPKPGTRAADDRVNHFIDRFLTPAHLQQVGGLVTLAKRVEMTSGQLALAFCLRGPSVSSAIVGATTVEQLEENAAAADKSLSAEMEQELEDLFPA